MTANLYDGQSLRVSHETIYAYVYGPDGQSEELARHLPHRRKKRQPRRRRTPRGLVFPPDRSIHERPDYVKTRNTFGEWEGDLMIFERAQGKTNVASLVERKTRFAGLFRNNDRSTTHLMIKLMGVMESLPQPARKSNTFGRRIKFCDWRKLKPGIGTEAWFCDRQAPSRDIAARYAVGQCVANGFCREPQQSGFTDTRCGITRCYHSQNHQTKSLWDHLNAIPRKCLGYRSQAEAFRDELMKLERR